MQTNTTSIENALLIEVDNRQGVYLYWENNKWCAYEHSAYYLSALKLPVIFKQEKVDGVDLIVLKAYLDTTNISDHLTPGVKLVQMADNMLKYQTNTLFQGFREWKQDMLGALDMAS